VLEEPTLVRVAECETKVPLEALAVLLTSELDCAIPVVLIVVVRLRDALVAELEASVGLIVSFPVVNVEGRLVVIPEDGDSVVVNAPASGVLDWVPVDVLKGLVREVVKAGASEVIAFELSEVFEAVETTLRGVDVDDCVVDAAEKFERILPNIVVDSVVLSDTVTVEAGTVSVVVDAGVKGELPVPEVVSFDKTDVPVERDGEIEVGARVSSESSDELSSPVVTVELVADDPDCVVLGRVGGVTKVVETAEDTESVGCVEFAPVDTDGLPLVGTEVEDLTDESVIDELVVMVVV
jgi:hypothetical protein